LDDYIIPRDKYVAQCGKNAFITYAVLREGKWYARGEMGWWGISSDEKDDWDEKFFEMLNEIPEDTLLTVVDCHI